METLKDFLECDLFNKYDYVEVRDYDNDLIIFERMTIKELWQHFHDAESYLAEEFDLMDIYCGNSFKTESGFYKGYITLIVRYE